MKNKSSFLIKWLTFGASIALLLAFTFQVVSPNIPNPNPRYAECYKMQAEGLRIGCPNIASKAGFTHSKVPEYTLMAILINFLFYISVVVLLLVVMKMLWHNKTKHKY